MSKLWTPDMMVPEDQRDITSTATVDLDILKDTPWENVAERIPAGSTVEEILEIAGLNWEVQKLPVFTEVEVDVPFPDRTPELTTIRKTTQRIHIDKNYTCLRMDTLKPVSPFLGPRYKLIQNQEAFEAFEQFCLAGDLELETAGALSDGKHVWALASIGEGIEVVPGEVIKGYFLLFQSHYYGHSLKAMFTPVRFPGGHTIVKALNVRNKKGFYTMPHSRVFNSDRRAEIELLVERAQESLEKYVRDAQFMANAGFTEADGVYYFARVWDKDLSRKLKEKGTSLPLTYREALESSDLSRPAKQAIGFMNEVPGADLPSMKGTAWGAFQTVSYGIDKAMGKGVNTRLESSWVGKNAKVKERAYTLASTMAAMREPSQPARPAPGTQIVLETEDA